MKKLFVALLSIGTLVTLIRKSLQKKNPAEDEALFERPDNETKGPTEEMGASVDINRTSEEGFLQVPGIGEDLASKIVSHREEHGTFTTIEELVNVTGIGEKKLDTIRAFIRVD